MKKLLLIGALAANSAMYAVTVVVPGAGATNWQTITGAPPLSGPIITPANTVPGAGNAFWNNDSSDASGPPNQCANIGCYITGTGYFAGWPAPPDFPTPGGLVNPAYLGQTNGAAEDFSFQGVPAAPGATMLVELAQFNTSNWLGWYDSNYAGPFDSTSYALGKWGVIFTGGSSPVTSATFTPTGNFGLWFLSNFETTPTDTFNTVLTQNQIGAALTTSGMFTQSYLNPVAGGEKNNQHFALFARSAAAGDTLPADYWIGIEDLPLFGSPLGSDRDYNDMIVRLRVVPEPGYYVLLSLGLAGLGFARRRMNKTSVN